MIVPVTAAAIGCGLMLLIAVVGLVRDTAPGRLFLLVAGATTLALVVVLGFGVAEVVTAERTGGAGTVVTYLAYLAAAAAAVPVALLWAAAERTRSGTLVLLVAALTVPFLLVRALDVWSVRG
ncbi:hypothetical protein KLP28_10145 [Nocardioidaceae bacterium]|nr:hypothetical protein KLP28_10145 [Nocardioidaceae bacterium]